jgi:hypothetical protein
MRSKRDFSNLANGQPDSCMRKSWYKDYILDVAQVASRSRASRCESARGGVDVRREGEGGGPLGIIIGMRASWRKWSATRFRATMARLQGKRLFVGSRALDVHQESSVKVSTTERLLVSPAEAWDRHPHQLT